MTGKGALRLGRSDTRVPSQGGIGAPCIGMYEPSSPVTETWEQMRGSG